MGKVVDPDLLRQRLQVPLQIVANAERRSGRCEIGERNGRKIDDLGCQRGGCRRGGSAQVRRSEAAREG